MWSLLFNISFDVVMPLLDGASGVEDAELSVAHRKSDMGTGIRHTSMFSTIDGYTPICLIQ
jgi:hypothetical protein